MSMRSLVVLCVLGLAGCGDDSAGSATESGSTTGGETTTTGAVPTTTAELPTTSDGTGAGVCVPGDALTCACPEDQVGMSTCKDDGSGFEGCVCPAAACGDGKVDDGEVCDDGVNDGGYGGCAADCSAVGPGCGDAEINGPEACDDGDDVDGDGCNVDCVVSGSEVWTQGYGGEDAGNAKARGVAVDGDGNVIVVGQEFVVGQNANVWLRKYTPDGEVLWSKAWDGPSSGDDIAYAVAVDLATGEYVLTGEQYEAGSGADIFVTKLAADGAEIWTQSHSGSASFGDHGFGVAVDASGNIAVTGEEYKAIGLHNVWTRLMDSAGTELWTDVFDANAGNDSGNAVAFTAEGDVVVAGQIYVPIGLADLWLRKYKADGTVMWTRSLDNMGGNDGWNAIAIDGEGNIGVAGHVYEVAGLAAIAVSKYNKSGFPQWIKFQDSDGGDNDFGHGVAFDAGGDLVAVGQEYTANDFARTWVRKYDGEGETLWTQVHDGKDSGDDIAWAVAIDGDGYVYAAGEEYAINQFAEVWVQKYAP